MLILCSGRPKPPKHLRSRADRVGQLADLVNLDGHDLTRLEPTLRLETCRWTQRPAIATPNSIRCHFSDSGGCKSCQGKGSSVAGLCSCAGATEDFLPRPTPKGVPVRITVPGSRVVSCERKEMILAQVVTLIV